MKAVYNTPEYFVWQDMKQRCFNPKSQRYRLYGARGITVSNEWKNSFAKFISDMGKRPSKKLSLDRVDNDGNYCKENCRWATQKEQCNNRRNNVLFNYNGELVTMSELKDISGIPQPTLWVRINKMGMSVEDAISKPTAKCIFYKKKKFFSIRQLAVYVGLSPSTLRYRLQRMSLNEAVKIILF